MAALHLVSPQHDHDAVMNRLAGHTRYDMHDDLWVLVAGTRMRTHIHARTWCLPALGGVPRESRDRQPGGQAAHAAL